MSLSLKDIMSTRLITVKPDDKVIDHVDLFQGNKIHHAPVIDGRGDPIGMVSVRDFENFVNITRLMESGNNRPLKIKDIMTEPIFAYTEDVTVKAAAQAMIDNNLNSVVVVDEKEKISGIVTSTDIMRLVAEGRLK